MTGSYQRFLKQRLSRRRLLAGTAGAALGAAGVGLIACGGDEDIGGILRVRALDRPLPSMNPFGIGIANLAQGLVLGFTVFDHLWYVPTDTGIREPFLATEIEQIDELTVRVKVGEGVFHNKPPVDGREVRVSDIKASIERFREVPPIAFSWLHHVFDRMETPDERTAIYKQNRPWAWFFTSSNAGSPISSSILPEEILDDTEFLNRDAIGSGRWILEGHDNGANIRLRKFPNWREPGLPLLDGVNLVTISDDALALAAFAAKDLDYILTGLNRLQVEDLQRRLGDQIVTSTDLSRGYRTLMLKYEQPFLDDRARRGINLALDRQEIRQALDLGDGELAGPVPPAHRRYALDASDSDLQEYFRHDPTEAKELLERAGFPFDQEIELKFPNTETETQLAQVLEQQLRRVGLKLKLTPEDLLTVWLPQTLNRGSFQMTCFTHLPYEDPDLPLRFYLSSTAERTNFMGYQDEEVDEAILAAAQELDEERRVELTKEAQRVVIQKWAPMLNLYSPVTHGARWSYLKGVVTGRGSYGFFNTRTWLDK